VVEADSFGVFAAGDSVHDPIAMSLQSAAAPAGPWVPVIAMTGTAGLATRQVFKFGDQMTVRSRYWRWIVHSVTPSNMCAGSPSCQLWVGEVQLHAVKGGWLVNNGTAARPSVLASSGNTTDTMPAWKAADGINDFTEALAHGWDACPSPKSCGFVPLPGPMPPSPPPGDTVAKQWTWDGVNGNNAVWTGSSAAGIRLFPKGPEDEWQAS